MLVRIACYEVISNELSLAIALWVGAVSTSESWAVNRHTLGCTSFVSVVLQCKLVSIEISASHWPS